MNPPKMPKAPKAPKAISGGLDSAATFLNSRNSREKYLLIVFVGVFILTLDYFLWLAPVLKTFNEVSPKIAPQREELKALKEDLKNRDAIAAKWESAKAELAEKDHMFVAPDETPALLENLSRQAQKAGVKIMSLEPSDAPKGGSAKSLYSPLPLLMKASAGTHELGALLSTLETGKTFFRIKDLRIASNPLSERKHVIELSMEAYKREK